MRRRRRGTRLVPRRYTRQRLAPEPWSWRETSPSGAPRTLLTNVQRPVLVTRGETTLVAGTFDWLLRLYQHRGATLQSVLHDGQVLYDLEHEWLLLLDRADWIELVRDPDEVVYRIPFSEALRGGNVIDTPFGPRWAVPLDHYSKHTQE